MIAEHVITHSAMTNVMPKVGLGISGAINVVGVAWGVLLGLGVGLGVLVGCVNGRIK